MSNMVKRVPKNSIDLEEITVRYYQQSDFEETSEILEQFYTFYGGIKKITWRKNSGLRQFGPNVRRATLIAEYKETGTILGMGILEASKDSSGHLIGFLDNLATRKECVGKQIGKIIVERGIEILNSWGCKSLRINVRYGGPEKLLNLFKLRGFNPKFIVLEKSSDKEEKNLID